MTRHARSVPAAGSGRDPGSPLSQRHRVTTSPVPPPQQVNTRKDARYSLKASYVEIYNENVFDLIHFKQKSLPVKWDATYGFYVQVAGLRGRRPGGGDGVGGGVKGGGPAGRVEVWRAFVCVRGGTGSSCCACHPMIGVDGFGNMGGRRAPGRGGGASPLWGLVTAGVGGGAKVCSVYRGDPVCHVQHHVAASPSSLWRPLHPSVI
jgi:hypothetical protein